MVEKLGLFLRIDEFLEESKLTFEELWLNQEEFDWETLSYLITSILERFPSVWEEINIPLKTINDDEIAFLKRGKDNALPERQLLIRVNQINDNTIWDLRIIIV